MSDACRTIKREENKYNRKINALFKLDLNHAFENLFLEPNIVTNRLGHKYWNMTKDLLMEYSYNYGLNHYNGRIQNLGSFFAQYREDNVPTLNGKTLDFVAKDKNTLGWRIVGTFFRHAIIENSIPDPYYLTASKQGYKGIYETIKEMIARKEADFMEDFFANGMKPKSTTMFWQEGSEIFDKLLVEGELIDESAIKKYKPTVDAIQNVYKNLRNSLYTGKAKGDINELIIGNVTGMYVGKKSNPNNEVQVLKVNYRQGSKIVESVDVRYINRDGKPIETVPIKKMNLKKQKDMTIALRDELLNKGINTFVDDLMSGQVQYWIPQKTTDNFEKLQGIGERISYDNKKRNLMEKKEKEAKALGIPFNQTGASPYIKMKTGYVNGRAVKIFYTVIKKSEADVGEKYEVFITKHKFEDEDKTVYYYSMNSQTGEWFKNKNVQNLELSDIQGRTVGRRSEKQPFIQEGYHKANSQKQYGSYINKNGDEIKGSFLKGWDDFTRIKDSYTPNDYVKEQIDNTVRELRKINEYLFTNLKTRIENIAVRYRNIYGKISKLLGGNLTELSKKAIQAENFEKAYGVSQFSTKMRESLVEQVEIVEKFLEHLGIENMSSVNHYGRIIFPFESLNKMGENYNQTSFSKTNRNMFIMNELTRVEAVRDNYNELLRQEKDVKKQENLKQKLIEINEQIHDYQEYFDMQTNTTDQDDGLLHGSINVKSSKHRLPTDETKRQKDVGSKINKVKQTFQEMERLNFAASLLETIYDLMQNSAVLNKKIEPVVKNNKMFFDFDNQTIKDLINYSKIVLKDITAQSKFLFWKTDYQSAANRMNQGRLFKPWHWGRGDITPEYAKHILNGRRAFFTQHFIRSDVAIQNSFQHFLTMGVWGKELHREAIEEYKTNTEYWDDVCETGGAGNILKAFFDMISADAMVSEINDGLAYNVAKGFKIFHPGNTFNYLLLKDMSKEQWYKELNKGGYKQGLIKLGKIASLRFKLQKKHLEKNIDFVKTETDEEVYRNMVNMIHDLLNVPQNNKTTARMAAIVKNANMDMADKTMKKFVKFAMEYRFGSHLRHLENLTSFSATEMENHKISYIMALLAADKFGVLGVTNEQRNSENFDIREIDPNGDRFKSNIAIEYGRKSIQIFQFMHSMAGTGEWSWNAGSSKMQFKHFPYNRQKLHNDTKRFLRKSSNNRFHMWKRIAVEDWKTVKNKTKSVFNLTFNQNVDTEKDQYGDTNIDYEARRYVFLRNAAFVSSLFAFVAYQLNFPVIGKGLRNSPILKGTRGLESPIQSIKNTLLLNMLVGLLVESLRADDDEKKNRFLEDSFLYTLTQFARLLIPLTYSFLGQKAIEIFNGISNLYDDEENIY